MKRKAKDPSGHLSMLPARFVSKLCKFHEGPSDRGVLIAGQLVVVPLKSPSGYPWREGTRGAFREGCVPEVLRTESPMDYAESVGNCEVIGIGV